MRRPALKAAPAPRAAPLGPVVEIALSDIVGLDPRNARRIAADADAVARLADDIRLNGLINPLLVTGTKPYLVLAGGRRYRAIKLFARPADRVLCRIVDADDVDAAMLSLVENLDREDLHPLEEADGVATEAHAHSIAAVARGLARSEDWVKKRIKLSELPAVAREAWSAGRIGLPQAQALCRGDAKSVEALFAHPQAASILRDERAIRATLTARGVASTDPGARYVGLDAYVAAGGETETDLFDGVTILRDPGLLRWLEREKIAQEAARICKDEGWGYQFFDAQPRRPLAARGHIKSEQAELASIRERIEASPLDAADLEARAAELDRLGALRAISKSDRVRYGASFVLDSEGRLHVVRGIIVDGRASPQTAPATPVDEAASAQAPRAEAVNPITKQPEHRPASAPPAAAGLPAEARRIAEREASVTAAVIVQDLLIGDVLRVALAALVAKGNSPFELYRGEPGPGGKPGKLLRDLSRHDFGAALDMARVAADAEIEEAFAELIACAVELRGANESAMHGLIGFIDRVDDDSFAPAFASDFDYAAYFAAAGRAASLAAIRDVAGEAIESRCAGYGDDDLFKEAALLARAKCWMPAFLWGTT